mgnify:FL=1|tara:strand:+ start:278 stop:1168 length:891 start_codon:yes stop_codon:yes gene_type:complete
MLTDIQKKFYDDEGYLLVEDVLSEDQLNQINKITNDLIDKSRNINKSNDVYDLEEGHSYSSPRLTRIKQPHQVNKFFWDIIKESKIENILKDLLGKNISLKTSKLNTKYPDGGSAIEWHQDWVFYPHTNDDVLALGLMLNDVDHDNGPLMVIPRSHKGPVLSHENEEGLFCGAINPKDPNFNMNKAVTLTGRAGSMSIHHARTLHGSAANNSEKNRLILFYECNSADAWPLVGTGVYLKQSSPVDLWKQMQSQMLCGNVCLTPRMTSVPIRLPLPPPPDYGSIFKTQKTGKAKSAF